MIFGSFLVFFLQILVVYGDNLVGLKNNGQTCYANAVFQWLYHNKDFRGSLEKYLSGEEGGEDGGRLSSLNNIFKQMDDRQNIQNVINPSDFSALPETFLPGTQYDVAEVLNYYQSIPNFDWSPFTIEIQKNSVSFSQYFLELLLNVPEIKILHLEDLMVNHFLKGGRRIKSLPTNLIVRIKRVHRVRGIDEKIIDNIVIPETIKLQPFCLNPSGPVDYHLEAFIEHCGSCSTGGHYVFYLNHSGTGKFFAISDENVVELDKEEFLGKAAKAYLLLFKPQ